MPDHRVHRDKRAEVIGITDIVEATEAYKTDTNFWNRVLSSKDLRAKLRFGEIANRKYPADVLPFFVWYAKENAAGNRNATSGQGDWMYELWQKEDHSEAAVPSSDEDAMAEPAYVEGSSLQPLNNQQSNVQYGNVQPLNVDGAMSPQMRQLVTGIASELAREIRVDGLPMSQMDEETLTAEEVAAQLKVSVSFVHKNVPAMRMGGRIKRWRLSDVKAFMRSRPRY